MKNIYICITYTKIFHKEYNLDARMYNYVYMLSK